MDDRGVDFVGLTVNGGGGGGGEYTYERSFEVCVCS